jgi:hypothetical protein
MKEGGIHDKTNVPAGSKQVLKSFSWDGHHESGKIDLKGVPVECYSWWIIY